MFELADGSGAVDLTVIMEMVLLWLIAACAFLAIIFAILMVRQAGRMVEIMPTPISPVVRMVAMAYVVFTVVVLGLIVNYLV